MAGRMAVQARGEVREMEIFSLRKDNKKREGESRRPNFARWIVALLLLSAIPAALFVWPHVRRLESDLREWALNHPYFSVQEIRVRAGEKVGGSEIVAMAGMNRGMNIWKIDPAAIERKVGKHPWVKRVLVRRELPRRVVIEVEEREVKGIVVLGKLYYVDADGFVFKEVEEGEKSDFPMLTGLRREELASHVQAARQKIREALQLVEMTKGSALTLSEIRFSDQSGLILYPMSYPVALVMGWGGWQAKLERLERVLAMWKGKESRLASLDVSFRDQVVAKIRKG